MLGFKNRLTQASDFSKVRRQGRVVQSTSFALSLLNRKDNEPSRFGFIIPADIVKQATHRNRVKRVLSEGLRLNIYQMKGGCDGVLLVKRGVERKSTSELMSEVNSVLQKCGLIQK